MDPSAQDSGYEVDEKGAPTGKNPDLTLIPPNVVYCYVAYADTKAFDSLKNRKFLWPNQLFDPQVDKGWIQNYMVDVGPTNKFTKLVGPEATIKGVGHVGMKENREVMKNMLMNLRAALKYDGTPEARVEEELKKLYPEELLLEFGIIKKQP
jgi:hypothetical protein